MIHKIKVFKNKRRNWKIAVDGEVVTHTFPSWEAAVSAARQRVRLDAYRMARESLKAEPGVYTAMPAYCVTGKTLPDKLHRLHKWAANYDFELDIAYDWDERGYITFYIADIGRSNVEVE